jgi:SAM-dependent methyltransferase
MFKHYLYVSGTSLTYKKYLDWFAEFTGAQKGWRVLDIGCNDGTQLDSFKALGCETWGIDPAENLYPISSNNHKVQLGYFGPSYIPGVKFKVINAQNVFAHQHNPVDILIHAKELLEDDGKIYIQTSQADMVLNGEFDTIYHEHINFFNAYSFERLARRAGLELVGIEKTTIHGTSYMFILSKHGPIGKSVENEIHKEEENGLRSVKTYMKWAKDCIAMKERVINDLKGKRVIAYGAAAKGNTFLNFVNIRPEVIVDDNPLKQGMYSPGMRVQVVPSSWIKSLPLEESVVFFPLAWNFFEEIKNNILAIRDSKGDEFYNPFFLIKNMISS